MIGRERIAGLVLAGGRASRMGGGDKPLLDLAGRPMLAHVLERLAPQVAALAISANGDPARFAPFALPVLADDPATGERGPLGGILAGLRWAADRPGVTHLLSVAGDTPFLPRDLAPKLASAGDKSVVTAASGGRGHPTAALWALDLADELARFLAASPDWSIRTFVRGFPSGEVDFPAGPGLDPFFNVNTPEDLAAARAVLRAEER